MHKYIYAHTYIIFVATYHMIVLSVLLLYSKTFEQSEHQVTFSFQPEENTAIWAAISGNAILGHLLVLV